MIVRTMKALEIDTTMICFNYYRDEAIERMPRIAEEYDDDSMVETVRSHVIDYNSVWFNAMEGQRVVGFVAGYLSACPWNKRILTANISFIYMLPSHRSMASFNQLLTAFTEWARNCSATEITAGDIGIDIERSQTLYSHMGFKPILLMSKELNNE